MVRAGVQGDDLRGVIVHLYIGYRFLWAESQNFVNLNDLDLFSLLLNVKLVFSV